jgi:4-hydroxy-tetrahydrodipicolinate reductase
MGRQILSLASRSKQFHITGALESPNSPFLGRLVGELIDQKQLSVSITGSAQEAFGSAQVVIDFSSPESTLKNLIEAKKLGVGLVIGTTGLKDKQKQSIKAASRSIPIVLAPNMSLGVNLLFKLSLLAAETLGKEYRVEIVDVHHIHKKDSPSGTALELARQVADGLRIPYSRIVSSEDPHAKRKNGTIFILSKREGEVVGDHTVSFIVEGERVELTHRAFSRDAFASGALKAAQFIAAKKKGLYSMQDVLGLNSV